MTDINLHALGLAARWPKLTRLQADRHDFRRRLEKSAQQVNTARAHVPRARSADVDEAAAAVRAGRRPPEPKREADAKLALDRAERDREILSGVCQRIEEEYGEFQAQHQSELFRDVLRSRHGIARELAEHARAAQASYGRWADLARAVRDLTPAEPFDENAPAQRLTTAFVGVHTTQPSGISRGTVEQVLAYLADLAPAEDASDDAA